MSDVLAALDASLVDAELDAVEGDFTQRLAMAGAHTALMLGWAQDGASAELTPDERAEALEALDVQIAATTQMLEALRGASG